MSRVLLVLRSCINRITFRGSARVKLNVRISLWGSPGSITGKKALLLLTLASIFWPLTGVQGHWKIPAGIKHWKTLETTHFKIHYPRGYEEMAVTASVYAEEAAARLERVMNHRLRRVVPVFLYASHQDFSATNIVPIPIGEGTGGFTDFLRRRVVVPFNGDYSSLRHVLSHEIVHAFQFDILSGDNFGTYPLWLMEGMAEYLTLGWDASGELHVRDAVYYNRMPTLAELQARRVRSGFMYYKGGQAVMHFIAVRWGEEYIARYLKEVKALRGIGQALKSIFDMEPSDFDAEFGRFLRKRYGKALKEKSVDPRLRRVTFRYRDRIGFNMHPVLSPDGKHIAYLSVAGIFPALVIRPTPGPGVPVSKAKERRVIIKALRSKNYEEWQPLTTRLSFSPDGKSILVAGRRSGRQALLVIDVDQGRVKRSFSPPFDALQYPFLSPSGKWIAFTGVIRGRADLYVLNFKSGRLQRLTNDWNHESAPRFSPDEKFIYYSSNRVAREPLRVDARRRVIYRTAVRGDSEPVLIAAPPGISDIPMPGTGGSLIIRSNFTGVPNLYRLENAPTRTTPAGMADLQPLTRSPTGVIQASLRERAAPGGGKGETLVFAEIEEGAYEIKLLPSDGKQRISPVGVLPAAERTYDPSGFSLPMTGTAVDQPIQPLRLGEDYRSRLAIEGVPFLLITGSRDANGDGGVAAFLFGQMADDTGDHRLRALVNYVDQPRTLNMDIQYVFTRYRMDFFAGIFRQNGTFPISSLDFSANSLLFNPNFRIIDQETAGVYLGVQYPLHRFGSVLATLEQGREERTFRQELPEEREQNDIFRNYQQATIGYLKDNTAYSIFGALDGHSINAIYSFPIRATATERELYAATFQYRFYHLFDNFTTFAFKFYAAAVSGGDAQDYPLRLGGFYTLRGYRFLEFEGTKAFLFNVEYRFNFSNFFSILGLNLGTLRGVFFLDAGAAFDDLQRFQAYDGNFGVTRDLNMSFGFGLQWVNILRGVLPGTTMKVEWATPWDTKRALPPKKWRGEFSLGFSFD